MQFYDYHTRFPLCMFHTDTVCNENILKTLKESLALSKCTHSHQFGVVINYTLQLAIFIITPDDAKGSLGF